MHDVLKVWNSHMPKTCKKMLKYPLESSPTNLAKAVSTSQNPTRSAPIRPSCAQHPHEHEGAPVFRESEQETVGILGVWFLSPQMQRCPVIFPFSFEEKRCS